MKLAFPILFCLAFVLSAAQPVNLSQIQSKPYPGVMVNTGSGWVQARIDGTLQIISGNPPTLHAVGGGAGMPGPMGSSGPAGPVGPQGVQGPIGPQGVQGPAAPTLPITVLPSGLLNIPGGASFGVPGVPTKFYFTKADGTTCKIGVLATGAVVCQ